ncbi:MAG TPA: DUF4340 domain-containing protein [Burkholderiales bacterium]|nr:DUF4340 domain-containing protein [Burkholderiales bacterium]
MKSRLWLNLILLVAVGALAAVFYFKPKIEAQSGFRLSSLQAGAVKKIVIAKTADSPITVEKHGDHWFITAPIKARADSNLISGVLDLLSLTAKQRLPATDLTRFDLKQPWARLTFDNQEISFGDQHPLTREQFIATEGYVYLIPPQYTRALSLPSNYFLSHRPLTENETPVGFELPGLTLTQKEGKWESSPAIKLTQDQLNRFADEWRHAYCMSSRLVSGQKGPPIKIRLANGSAVNFQLLQKEPDVVLLREDEGIAYQFPTEIGLRLLDPLAAIQAQK